MFRTIVGTGEAGETTDAQQRARHHTKANNLNILFSEAVEGSICFGV